MIRSFFRYLREHRWHRRLLTALLAVIIGAVLGLLLYPLYRDRSLRLRDESLISNLGSEDEKTRRAAMAEISALAEESVDTLDRLVDALATQSDRRFVTVVAVLGSLARGSAEVRDRLSGAGLHRLKDSLETDSDLRFTKMVGLLELIDRFDTPGRDPAHLDRLNTIHLGEGPGDQFVDGRWMILAEMLAAGRDNRYVRKALALACADASPDVRELASMFAARLADDEADEALGNLLLDKDPAVVSAAALSAAAGGRGGLTNLLTALLDGDGGVEVVSASAYSLAKLDPVSSAPQICGLLLAADSSSALRDRLLHVMTVLDNDAARKAVSAVLASARREERYPPALALLAAGKLKMAQAEPDVRAVLADSRKNDTLPIRHIRAAVRAAELLDLTVREEVFLLCRDLWGRCEPLTAVSAIRALGRQAAKDQPHDKSTRARCINLLQGAADSAHRPQSWPGRAEKVTAELLPGAAAAVSLWLLEARDSKELLLLDPKGRDRDWFIRQASHNDDELSLPGDYVAWHLGLCERTARAMALGMKLLPPLRGGELGPEVRAAGAMLLALSARTEKQKAAAIERIALRLKHENKPYAAGAYRCALLMLGRADELGAARALRGAVSFPRRRVMTALLAVGDKDTVDWFLLDRHKPLEDIAGLLTFLYIGEVLAATAPDLPQVDLAADGAMQNWQARIMRHHWGVMRAKIAVGLRK